MRNVTYRALTMRDRALTMRNELSQWALTTSNVFKLSQWKVSRWEMSHIELSQWEIELSQWEMSSHNEKWALTMSSHNEQCLCLSQRELPWWELRDISTCDISHHGSSHCEGWKTLLIVRAHCESGSHELPWWEMYLSVTMRAPMMRNATRMGWLWLVGSIKL